MTRKTNWSFLVNSVNLLAYISEDYTTAYMNFDSDCNQMTQLATCTIKFVAASVEFSCSKNSLSQRRKLLVAWGRVNVVCGLSSESP